MVQTATFLILLTQAVEAVQEEAQAVEGILLMQTAVQEVTVIQ